MKHLLKRDEVEEGRRLLQSSINLVFWKTLLPDVLTIVVEWMQTRTEDVSVPGDYGKDALDILEYAARKCQSRSYSYFISTQTFVD